jgi:catechol 2,3-dioxygenase-like lactoylglutathione lyase family enzyme
MLKPVALTETHMECRSLRETLPVLTDLLAFETVSDNGAEVILKHPNSAWRLVVHEGGAAAPDKQMLNHWGVRVATRPEVDAAAEYLRAHQARYGLRQIGQPNFAHGSYSLYFLEPGTNGWEIECYEDALRKGKGADRAGGVWVPPWDRALPAERFPGRGYVPQAFTHGTIACRDKDVSARFYTDVLGLEVHHANKVAMYLKAPRSRCYIVSAVRESWKRFSPTFRFTLELGSSSDVGSAHRWLSESRAALGVTDLGPLSTRGGIESFFVSDPDGNWWEITAPAGA